MTIHNKKNSSDFSGHPHLETDTDTTCNSDGHTKDFDYIVSPFMERTEGKTGLGYTAFWVLFALVLLFIRLGSMYLCEEAPGRYFINAIFAILPSLQALLIIQYSKETEQMTTTFCQFICDKPQKTVGWCEDQIRFIFNDKSMRRCGVLFIILFIAFLPSGELFPTPKHNATHIQKAMNSTKVNWGFIQGEIDGKEQTMTFGWSNITLGKAKKLNEETLKQHLGKALQPPQQNTESNWKWGISQATYLIMMLSVLFMGGAMFWCLIGIVRLTWNLSDKKAIKIHVFPHPVVSIKSVGTFLGKIAFMSSAMFGLVMCGLYIARPDSTTFTLAAMFSIPTVLIFLLPQYNLHKLMLKIKYDKISPLGDAFEKALNKARTDPTKENIERAHAILQLQHSMTMGSEWPFDLQTLINVIGSIAIPLALGVLALYQQTP